jgi:hypothetical protein
MSGTAICALLTPDAGFYAVLDYRMGHGLPFGTAAVLLYQLWLLTIASLPLVILLFPDGRLPSARWRWALWSYLGLVFAFLAVLTARTASLLAAGRIRVDPVGQLTVFDRPSGWLAGVQDLALVTLITFWLVFVGYQVLSWRRSTGERRQQLKWLLSGGVVAISLGLLAGSFTTGIVSDIVSFAILALPVGIGIGILKYRLYEIDRIISRTLAYVIVTGLLVGVYAGLVLLATHVLSVRTPPAVAAATLAAAALGPRVFRSDGLQASRSASTAARASAMLLSSATPRSSGIIAGDSRARVSSVLTKVTSLTPSGVSACRSHGSRWSQPSRGVPGA